MQERVLLKTTLPDYQYEPGIRMLIRDLIENALDAATVGKVHVGLRIRADGRIVFSVMNPGRIDWDNLRNGIHLAVAEHRLYKEGNAYFMLPAAKRSIDCPIVNYCSLRI